MVYKFLCQNRGERYPRNVGLSHNSRSLEIEQHFPNWYVQEQSCFKHRKIQESSSYFDLKIHDPSCYSTNPQSLVIPGSSVVIAKQSAVIAQKYQNYKVHDQGCSEHPEFQESTQ